MDDPSIDTTSRTGKLVMGILALIAEFENDIRRERQMDGIAKAKERGVHFGRRLELTPEKIAEIKSLRRSGMTVHAMAAIPILAHAKENEPPGEPMTSQLSER